MDTTATQLDSSGPSSHNDDGALQPGTDHNRYSQGPVRDNTKQPKTRYVGIDIARFLAIVGMISVHLVAIQTNYPDVSAFELRAAHLSEMIAGGTSAALFAVLGGVSTVFATRRLLRQGRVGSAMFAVVVRGLILIVIGLLLGLIPGSIAVVLTYYGLSMILVAPLLTAPNWLLAGLAGVLAVVVGPLNAMVRNSLEIVMDTGGMTFGSLFTDPLASLRGLLLTGIYPAATWCVYLMVGMMIGRFVVSADARDRLKHAAVTLTTIGVSMATLAGLVSSYVFNHLDQFGFTGFPGMSPDEQNALLLGSSFGAPVSSDLWAQLLATPHSGSIIDLLYTIGTSLTVIGLMVLLFDVAMAGHRNRAVEIVRSTGAAPLTIYSLHVIASGVLLIAAILTMPPSGEFVIPWWAAGTGIFAIQVLGALIIGAILAVTKRKGPLEALMSRIVRVAVERQSGASQN